ncbi:MAG: hypothetical protein M0P73_16320 [Syntrophobacterales bacterium]|jgi:hypothetical protein|nr:hypothetical protein [Syntrophobacterales bacterium]
MNLANPIERTDPLRVQTVWVRELEAPEDHFNIQVNRIGTRDLAFIRAHDGRRYPGTLADLLFACSGKTGLNTQEQVNARFYVQGPRGPIYRVAF